MSEEIQQEQTQEQQIDVAQEEAAMEASFAESRGEEPPVTVEAEQSPETGEQQTEPVKAEAKQEVLIAGLTEDQLKAALLKAGQVDELNTQLRKAFGRMGELQGHIQQLRQSSGSGGVKLSADKLKRLSSEFPEMAQMIAEDLSEALQGSGGGAAFDPAQMDQFVTERLTASETKIHQEMEKRWLTRQHKDWQTVVNSDDFGLWVQNVLPKEEAAALGNSWDAEFISDKLSEFKSWRDQSAGTANRSKENKQKRLEAAVAPTGNRGEPNATMSEDDAMEQAFRAARRL